MAKVTCRSALADSDDVSLESFKPTPQHGGVAREALFDLLANFSAIHVDRKIAILPNSCSGSCNLV